MKTGKKVISLVLCLIMLIGTVAVGGDGLAELLDVFSVKASAKIYDIYTYTVKDGEVTITRCDDSANGVIELPSDIEGHPITKIGDSAFSGCSLITSIIIPNSVMELGEMVFYCCTSLSQISLSNNIYKINHGDFWGCSGFTSYSIPNSITIIDDDAFRECTGLTNIEIPNSVTTIGEYAFCGCTSLSSVSIPNSISSISYGAFAGCEQIASITIPDNIESICDYAFSNCTGLLNITIPNNVTSIGDYAFEGCTELESVFLGNKTSSIGDNAFYGCTNLTSLNIPDSVTTIGKYCFAFCMSIESVLIGSGVTSIGDYAFEDLRALTNLSVDSNNTVFHSSNNCVVETATKTLVIGSNNSVIPSDGSVTSISARAFLGRNKLTNISIPRFVSSIGDKAFYGCLSLSNITVDKNNSVFHSFGNCIIETDSKTLILGCKNSIIPSDGSVKTIGDYSFYVCTNLKSIIIPNSVTRIGKYAFGGCSTLESINLPNSVTKIGERAFDGCRKLADVYYTGARHEWEQISTDPYNTPLFNAALHFVSSVGLEIESSDIFFGETETITVVLPDNATGTVEFYIDASETGVIVSVINGIALFEVDNLAVDSYTVIAVYSGDSCYESKTVYTEFDVKTHSDTAKPTCGLSSTNDVSDTQTAYLSMSDMVGLAGYYWGTSASYLDNTYTEISGTNQVVEKPISSTGTYYLTVKDTSDNISTTASISFYKTTFNANGGTVSQTEVLTKDGYAFILPVASRTGFTFDKWTVNADGSGKSYNAGDCYVVRSDITVYAKWNECLHDNSENKPTCTESAICSICSAVIPATGHSFTNYISDNNATCLKDGTKTAKCDNCDEKDTVTDEGSALGHDIIHHEGKASTCKEHGYSEYDTCSRCDYTTYSELPLGEHTIKITRINETEATCTSGGHHDNLVECGVCGTFLGFSSVEIEPLDHKDTDNDGVCDVCGIITDEAKHNKYLVGKAKLKIPAATDVEYGSSVTVIAKATGVPDGYYVALYDGGTLLAKGDNTEVSYTLPNEFTATKKLTVKIIDANKNVQKDSNGNDLSGSFELKVNSGFFAKLIAFFKRLFKALPAVTVEPK